jgi:hypothetical protein
VTAPEFRLDVAYSGLRRLLHEQQKRKQHTGVDGGLQPEEQRRQ